MNSQVQQILEKIKQRIEILEHGNNNKISTPLYELTNLKAFIALMPPDENEGYFPITSVHRDDIDMHFGIEGLGEKFTDSEMREIASSMADAYTGGDTYWIDLGIIAEHVAPHHFEGMEKVEEDDDDLDWDGD